MMSCAELLAVCLLSADRGPKPHRQPLPIFHDIFRRADKNDDGKLSFEEFKNYFSDGILSSEELWELFSGIDRRHSDNVDTEKLCDYFSAYLGEYRNVLSALETLNAAVLAAMDKTKLRYETSSKMEQFLTRFLLRETLHQLQSLQASLECAVDTVEEQAGRERKEIKKPEAWVGLRPGRRCRRRGQRNVCLSPTEPYSGMLTTGVCVEDNSQWKAQINRLQQLIEKLECKSPRLEPLKEEGECQGQDAHILVAKRQISVATSSIEEFRQAFRSYTEGTAGHSSCLQPNKGKMLAGTRAAERMGGFSLELMGFCHRGCLRRRRAGPALAVPVSRQLQPGPGGSAGLQGTAEPRVGAGTRLRVLGTLCCAVPLAWAPPAGSCRKGWSSAGSAAAAALHSCFPWPCRHPCCPPAFPGREGRWGASPRGQRAVGLCCELGSWPCASVPPRVKVTHTCSEGLAGWAVPGRG
ncbi:N-terminal EF-hand calcium-binding protein 3 isoform X1 [Prinia subflava]|uniref:N-terminal EF-hand calcium-binding protein 3 isoform X1 n=1 Tax=Prinia subflava TaxID=208062 RepID=UPI002FDF4432